MKSCRDEAGDTGNRFEKSYHKIMHDSKIIIGTYLPIKLNFAILKLSKSSLQLP